MVEGPSKTRAAIKFTFWTIMSLVFVCIVVQSHLSGQMARWYYHTAGEEGYAVNARNFMDASAERPALLTIGSFERIEGLQAVHVKKGDRLPSNANGVISLAVLKAEKRASLAGAQIKVLVPWEIKTAKGFKYKDTFKHKGIKTNPWAAVWNVLMVILMGISLGFMAEGMTDLLGIKFEKIVHFEGH